MKKKIIIGMSMLGVVIFNSCSNESNTSETEASATTTEEVVEDEAKPQVSCKLASYSFTLGDNSKTMNFIYEGDRVTSVETETSGQDEKQVMTYTYTEDGKLSSFKLGESAGTYVYTDGKLMEITGEGNITTRTFEYDAEGNISKQVTLFGGKPYMSFAYEYDNGAPVKIISIDKKGEVTEEKTITYGEAPNPFIGQAAFANSAEMMLGYPVGNYAKSIKSVSTKYMKKTSYMINGEYKNVGDVDVDDKNYEFDENGYIIAQIQKNGDKEIRTVFSYNCQS